MKPGEAGGYVGVGVWQAGRQAARQNTAGGEQVQQDLHRGIVVRQDKRRVERVASKDTEPSYHVGVCNDLALKR